MTLKVFYFPITIKTTKRVFQNNFHVRWLWYWFTKIWTFRTFLPYILLLTRISKSSTLIDNIFSNSTSLEKIESSNVTSTFSDDLPQFIFLKEFFSKISTVKSNILKHDWRKLQSNKFIADSNQTATGSKFYALRKVKYMYHLKTLTKKDWNFSPIHGLHKVYKILLKIK